MKKINSILLILIMILSLVLPMTNVVYASDERVEVDEVVGESTDIDSIPVWGAEYTNPNIEVLDRLNKTIIYRTDKDGSIMFKIKNNKLEVETCSP